MCEYVVDMMDDLGFVVTTDQSDENKYGVFINKIQIKTKNNKHI